MTRRFIIAGRVQGVSFRYFTQQAAARLGVKGWVRNNPDGTVEVVAQADAEILEDFKSRLSDGPRWAAVDSLQEHDGPEADFQSFTIQR
ncbi:MAG TPA: acylphosphatase [Acidobacteriota bacterium]|nr:acylphosphatase [Acidobacteriota bacterium]